MNQGKVPSSHLQSAFVEEMDKIGTDEYDNHPRKLSEEERALLENQVGFNSLEIFTTVPEFQFSVCYQYTGIVLPFLCFCSMDASFPLSKLECFRLLESMFLLIPMCLYTGTF